MCMDCVPRLAYRGMDLVRGSFFRCLGRLGGCGVGLGLGLRQENESENENENENGAATAIESDQDKKRTARDWRLRRRRQLSTPRTHGLLVRGDLTCGRLVRRRLGLGMELGLGRELGLGLGLGWERGALGWVLIRGWDLGRVCMVWVSVCVCGGDIRARRYLYLYRCRQRMR